MKKLLIATAFLVCTGVSLSAQDKDAKSKPTTFSLGLEAALPIGNFATVYSFGIGGSLQVEHMTSEKLGLTLNAGYVYYTVKSAYSSFLKGSGLIPVMAGAKIYFTPKVYGHAQLGAAFSASSGGGTAFAYSPGIGVNLTNSIDVLLKFVGMSSSGSSTNVVGLRLAYNFGK